MRSTREPWCGDNLKQRLRDPCRQRDRLLVADVLSEVTRVTRLAQHLEDADDHAVIRSHFPEGWSWARQNLATQ